MGQVTLYMDDDLLLRVREAAEASGQSISAWLTQLVRERTASEWPPVVASLAGQWSDLPTAEALRGEQPPDVEREEI